MFLFFGDRVVKGAVVTGVYAATTGVLRAHRSLVISKEV